MKFLFAINQTSRFCLWSTPFSCCYIILSQRGTSVRHESIDPSFLQNAKRCQEADLSLGAETTSAYSGCRPHSCLHLFGGVQKEKSLGNYTKWRHIFKIICLLMWSQFCHFKSVLWARFSANRWGMMDRYVTLRQQRGSF